MEIYVSNMDERNQFFLGNMRDITISDISGDTVEVILSVFADNEHRFFQKEKYIKDAQGTVTIHDVRSIIESLIVDDLKNGLTLGQKWIPYAQVQLYCTDESGDTNFNGIAIVSKGKIKAIPTQFKKFYTQYRNRTSRWYTMELINFGGLTRCKIGVGYRNADGIPKWETWQVACLEDRADIKAWAYWHKTVGCRFYGMYAHRS